MSKLRKRLKEIECKIQKLKDHKRPNKYSRIYENDLELVKESWLKSLYKKTDPDYFRSHYLGDWVKVNEDEEKAKDLYDKSRYNKWRLK